MEGPCSSYEARVWQTLLNSGVEASIEPPNQTAKRCNGQGGGARECERRLSEGGRGRRGCGVRVRVRVRVHVRVRVRVRVREVGCGGREHPCSPACGARSR